MLRPGFLPSRDSSFRVGEPALAACPLCAWVGLIGGRSADVDVAGFLRVLLTFIHCGREELDFDLWIPVGSWFRFVM